ncbi:glycosyltransferase family 87 protein [Haloarcula laminariae]|uniref:glycosyltransferase family 87 protein n=1 Tax=Haloarcula laminariae TaxID=2961577 RepID=UPI0021C8837A|nr:glycosyltransferase family 87 protein [Halomicroarcula laminariae]
MQKQDSTVSLFQARLALGFGISLGVAYLLYRLAIAPAQFGIDFEIYRAAAADLQSGQTIYGRSPVGISNLTYRYPVILLAPFSLYLLVSPVTGFAIHVAGTLLVSVLLGLAVARTTESYGLQLSKYDYILICGFIIISPIGAPSLVNGNINHHIAFALGLGLIWTEQGRERRGGIALGLAALPKVFPAAIGIWLVWKRKWCATFAAVFTGIGAVTAGAVLFGLNRTRRFFVEELLPRGTANSVSGGLSPSSLYVTLQRPLSAIFTGASGTVLTVLSLAIVTPVVAYVYLQSKGTIQRLIALLSTLCGILLVIPSYTMYFVLIFYPLIPLLYLLQGWPGRVFTGGVVLMQFTLKLHDAAMLVRLLGLPKWGTETVVASLRAFYTLSTPVLWGTVAVLIAGVWQIHTHPSG